MNMPLGRFWGSLFFLFMSFAAFSTVLAVFENILSCVKDMTNWTRNKTSIVCGILMIILSLPCALGFNKWSHIQPLGAGSGIMDLEDFIVSNCLLPLGSLIYVIYCTNKFGWGYDNFLKEANAGEGAKMPKALYLYCKIVLPIIIILIFGIGIKSVFFK